MKRLYLLSMTAILIVYCAIGASSVISEESTQAPTNTPSPAGQKAPDRPATQAVWEALARA